ncbi:MAG: WcaI family glycosyltransferase, partial [Stellaceae bacterium]
LILRRFDRVSAISSAMYAHAVEKGIAEAKLVLLPNWVATDEIFPLPGPSAMREALCLRPDTVVALYAGNMSEKQGLDTLVEAARRLAGDDRVGFVFAGEGAARARLEAMCAGLANVRFLPLQPAERLNELLNLADIHLLPQRAGVARLVMPSKLLGMTASGRPVIAGADPESALGKVAPCCGILVAPEDGRAMAVAVAALVDDAPRRARLGAAGRRYAVENWSRDVVLGRFLATVNALRRARTSGAGAAPVPLAGSSDGAD